MSRPFGEQLTEGQAIAGCAITTLNNTNISTSAMDMSLVRRARAIIHTGTLTSGASLNIALQASNTVNGTYTTIDLPTTDPVVNTFTTDDAWVSIEVRADQMPDGSPWLKAKITETTGNNAVVDAIIVGDCGSYSPNNDNDTVTFTNTVVGQ